MMKACFQYDAANIPAGLVCIWALLPQVVELRCIGNDL